MERKLLKRSRRIGTYTVTINEKKYNSLRIVLHPDCGFKATDKIHQVRRSDGVIELIPAELYEKMAKELNIEET